jgi:hypothetical protein
MFLLSDGDHFPVHPHAALSHVVANAVNRLDHEIGIWWVAYVALLVRQEPARGAHRLAVGGVGKQVWMINGHRDQVLDAALE